MNRQGFLPSIGKLQDEPARFSTSIGKTQDESARFSTSIGKTQDESATFVTTVSTLELDEIITTVLNMKSLQS